MDDTERLQAGLCGSYPYLTTKGEERSSSTSCSDSAISEKKSARVAHDCSASEIDVKAQLASLLSLMTDKDGSAWPENTEERTVYKDNGLFRKVRESTRSSGQSSTATSRYLTTDLEQKAEIETEEGAATGVGTATVTKSSTTTNIASGQGLFGGFTGLSDYDCSSSNLSGAKAKQPTRSGDAKAYSDNSKLTHSSKSSLFRSSGQTRSTQSEAASSVLAREAAFAANSFPESSHSDQGAQPDKKACLSSETIHSRPSPNARPLSNRPLDEESMSILRRKSDDFDE